MLTAFTIAATSSAICFVLGWIFGRTTENERLRTEIAYWKWAATHKVSPAMRYGHDASQTTGHDPS